jgi:hypothetical protein
MTTDVAAEQATRERGAERRGFARAASVLDTAAVDQPPKAPPAPVSLGFFSEFPYPPPTSGSGAVTITYTDMTQPKEKLPLPPAPLPAPAASPSTWIPLAIAVGTIVITAILAALQHLPANATPLEIVVIALGALLTVLTSVSALLAQAHAQAIHLLHMQAALGVR